MRTPVWTEAERAFIRDHAPTLKDAQVAEALSLTTGRRVTVHAVRHARVALGIRKRRGRGLCEVVT